MNFSTFDISFKGHTKGKEEFHIFPFAICIDKIFKVYVLNNRKMEDNTQDCLLKS